MTAEELAQRLGGHKSGSGWTAKCPAHEDREPSLSISEKDGVMLLHCHAGCPQEAVLAALELLGIAKKDLFPPRMFASANQQPQRGNAAKPPHVSSPPFDWQKCVAAFTDKHVAQVAKWRGFSIEFVHELREKGWIGIHKGLVAFPVHNDSKIVGTHYRLKTGKWKHFPTGIKASPLLFGKLTSGERVNVFESTWDGLDYMDKSGERDGIIITRGASNANLAAALIPKGSTVYLWTQNDEPDPKTGIKAGENWQSGFCAALTEPTVCVKRVLIPAHDLNDWSKNGASADDLLDAVMNAEILREAAPVSLEDFRAYMPQHLYIFIPSRDLWPTSSVDARLPMVGKIKASKWLDRNRPVEVMTWAPAKPMIIQDRLLISEGGWIERPGCSTFNLYRPPNIKLGNARKAGPWLDHVAMLYPHDKDHLIRWFAQRVQRPDVKINHALLIGGPQGIGKDTLIYPVKYAVGPWNVTEVLPPTLLGRFNSFVKSVILCVNEVHDLGDLDRYALYERLKNYTAAPPDVLRVDEKNLREHPVPNVCGVILTTNYKTGGLYLPTDDRRHYIAWSDFDKKKLPAGYWRKIYAWYSLGGIRHVAAYLTELDLSGFDPKAPPSKTDAFWEIVESNRAPENAELADALALLDNPDAVTIQMVVDVLPESSNEFGYWLKERKNSRLIPHRFEEVGYVAVRNPDQDEGRWKIKGRSYVIYAKQTLSIRDQITAARKLIEEIQP